MKKTLAFAYRGLDVLLVEEDGALVGLSFLRGDNEEETPLLLSWKKEVEEYLDGERKAFDLPFRLEGSPFQREVARKAMGIPYGETRSYGELLGPKSARAVGSALHRNPLAIIVPCHRVVGINNPLAYRYGSAIKEKLLELELNNK